MRKIERIFVHCTAGSQKTTLKQVSNGVRGFNSTSVNVSYVGGVDSKLKPIDNRTEAQKASLIKILTELKLRYPEAKIMGHRDIWGKDPKKWQKWCPCFDVSSEYAFLENTGLSETSKAEAEYAEIGKVKDPVEDLFFEKNVQGGNGLLDQIKTPVQQPVSHETLIKRIIRFLTSWVKKG